MFQHYRRLIALRRDHAIIRHGDFRLLQPDHASLFVYERRLDGECLLVVVNMAAQEMAIPVDAMPAVEGRDLLTGRPVSTRPGNTLAPFAAFAVLQGH